MSELQFCKFILILLLLFCGLLSSEAGRSRHHYSGKQALKFLKTHHRIGNHVRRNATSNTGLWPSVFNLATKAVISVNATCGERGREEFCRTTENGKGRCGYCDHFSADPAKRHTIEYAIDGTNRWWQSPSQFYGQDYEYVTIEIDLKQVYQIAYIIIKSANSPRPGTWILERSVNGLTYEPWQYYARNDKECLERFGVPATKGKPHYFTDSEVICTSFHSRFMPIENGEVHTSLVHGRPGANESSPELLEFTKARYVRIRLMGLRGTMEPLPRWFTQDLSRDKRLFYSIKDISIGGQCVCNGHAENCRHNVASGHPECECSHHTCGPNCDRCCPMFNQRQWAQGTSRDGHRCLPCNCHGHAASCHYDEDVDKAGLSMDVHGNYQGGGVCDNCTHYTTGINCEKCLPGYYRPPGIPPESEAPCIQCDCDPMGVTGPCQQDGTCQCKQGFAGSRCDECAPSFRGFPNCEMCPCDPKGTAIMDDCEGECTCKTNVEGKHCDRCKLGYFGLDEHNPDGCSSCFCSGITTLCESAIIKQQKIQELKGWLISDIQAAHFITPVFSEEAIFSVGNYELPGIESLYWLAPEIYLGNKLEAYNAYLRFKVQWVVMRGDTSGEPTVGPNVILIGSNGQQIAHGDDVYHSSSMTFNIKLKEEGWYHLPDNIVDITTRTKKHLYKGSQVTRKEFMEILTNIKRMLLRSSFHTDQIEALLEEASIDIGEDVDAYGFGGVEKCSCSSGYTGLSCEKCAFGFVRILANDSGHEQGFCGICDCNGHSETCNATTGECFCEHNTIGEKCERCAPGFYGNPLHGTPDDCRKCACPLENEENNFSPSCQLDYLIKNNEESYVCTQCPKGYTGDHCEICDDGYYGNPMEEGNSCQACECNGGPCDRFTGQCLSCKGNTEGWKCERCKPDHYGDPLVSNCKDCECDPLGSLSKQCDNVTGQCQCKERFTGRTCNSCETGFGNVTGLCTPCDCNKVGSTSETCDSHTGICTCRPGVDGFHCDACQNMYYGFSEDGCLPCNCDPVGSISTNCDALGNCRCQPNFIGSKCDKCKNGYYRYNRSGSCTPCNCHTDGSISDECDSNGQCNCKTGVTGFHCEKCLPHHYGNIRDGCKNCDDCNLPGHHCHPTTGKCVCPPNSTGRECNKCSKNFWGFEPGIGCKACDCSKTGSTNLQCDQINGICTCKVGYEGGKCNRCTDGYYGYPKCQPCKCSKEGSVSNMCDSRGQCKCKGLATGLKCDKCKTATFGLALDNPDGCIDCFCMGRSSVCSNANYAWDKVRTSMVPEEKDLSLCHLAPCWSLPKQFLGDLTTSYGGYLGVIATGLFDVYIENTKGLRIKSHHPVKNEIQFDDKNWRVQSIPSTLLWPEECEATPTRNCLMTILQSVKSIRIEAHHDSIKISEVLLDKAKKTSYHTTPTRTVEKCECPPKYSGLSCQNPSRGYYRYYPTNGTYIDRIVGDAKKCDCNGKSLECDPDTGDCIDCRDNTAGTYCEICASGYYKDSRKNRCEPCLCPSAEVNHATGCEMVPSGFRCICKEGYTGPKCDVCQEDYYLKNGKCEPCNCNDKTTISKKCTDGVCQCRPGFVGPTCSACNNTREYLKDDVCTPCDQCTQLLFQEVDKLSDAVHDTLHLFKGGVGPPWKKLTQTMEKHELLSEKYKNTNQKLNDLIKRADLDTYDEAVADLKFVIEDAQEQSFVNKGEVEKLNNAAVKIQDDIDILRRNLKKTIIYLNVFSTKHVDVDAALSEANKILAKITAHYDDLSSTKYEKQLKKCQAINNKVDEVYLDKNINPKKLGVLLDMLLEKLNDLNHINKEVENMFVLAKSKNSANRKRINLLKNKIKDINKSNDVMEMNLRNTSDKIEAASDALDQVDLIYGSLRNIDTDHFYKELAKRQSDDVIYDSLYDAEDHVRSLNETINMYKGLFNFTNEEKKKINAGEAYMTIIQQIKNFTKSAKDAQNQAKKATLMLYPEGDSLSDLAQLSNAYSDRLKKRIENMHAWGDNKTYKTVKDQILELKYIILKTGKDDNDLNYNITGVAARALDENKRKQLEEAIANSNNISDYMQRLVSKVYSINYTSQYDLFKDYQKYLQMLHQNEINDFKTQYAPQLNDIVNNSLLDQITERISNYKRLSNITTLNKITDKLVTLQQKIDEARQMVSSLNVYLSLRNCSRTYLVPMYELFESFRIQYNCTECNLITINFSKNASFNFKIKGDKVLVNDKDQMTRTIDSEPANTILLTRYGTTLKVQSDQDEILVFPGVLNGTATIASFMVGDVNTKSGVLYTMRYNRQNIGLWNFAQQEGHCEGAPVKLLPPSTNNRYWNGYGYGNYSVTKNNKLQKAFNFNVTTFDENSLIFLSYNETDCRYMALYIKDGKPVLNVNSFKMTLNAKINDGYPHIVPFRYVFTATKKMVKFGNEVKSLPPEDLYYITQNTTQLMAGVNPNFKCRTKLSFTQTSFLGYLSEDTDELKISRSFGSSFNVPFEFSYFWLNKNSKLTLEFMPQKLKSFSFFIRPYKSTRGFVMSISDWVKIYLKDEKLEIIDSKYGKVTLKNKLKMDEYNYIGIKNNNCILNENVQPCKLSDKVANPLRIVFGDEPSFDGGIYEMILNEDMKLMLNSTSVQQSFRHVDIGRERTKRSTEIILANSRKHDVKIDGMQNTESCVSFPPVIYLDEAIKFGDKPHSFMEVHPVDLKKPFSINIVLRTFYPSGMVLLALGNKNKPHNFFLSINNGKLQLNIKGKKPAQIFIVDKFVSDGDWHNITVTKQKIRKKAQIKISVDDVSKTIPINAFNVQKKMYLGTVPPEVKVKNLVIHPFRGCVRSLKINDIERKPNFTMNTGKCLVSVESAAYFNGKSYAIYKNDFKVAGNQVMIHFQFRTSEQNGVIFRVPNRDYRRAFSIELVNGAMVMFVERSQGLVNVTNIHGGEFSLCNNQWHNVTATYQSDELTIIVDGIIKTWVVIKDTINDITAPLYIGGFKGVRSRGQFNFIGCIRNIKLYNDITDWTDMEELNNVMLNSCPVRV